MLIRLLILWLLAIFFTWLLGTFGIDMYRVFGGHPRLGMFVLLGLLVICLNILEVGEKE
jgi:hypothetical protein